MSSLKLMKLIDNVVGKMLCFLFTPLAKLKRRNPVSYPADVRKLLIIKFWGLGSIVLVSPTLAKLKDKYQGCRIFFLTFEGNRGVCGMIPDIDEIMTIRMAGVLDFIKDTICVIWRIRREQFDFVVDLEFFTRFSALITFVSKAKVKAGFHAWEAYRGNLHDIRAPFNYYWHVTDSFMSLATGATDSSSNASLPRVIVPEDAKRWAEQLREESKALPGTKVIVVNPNAGELALERRWPKENFVRLLQILEDKYDVKIFLIGGSNEEEYTAGILREAGTKKVENLAGKLPIPQLAALLSCADLVITNDSGPLHLACSVRTPTISFFGPETPVLYGPLGDAHRVFFKDINCSPCINVHDAKTVRCRHGNSDCLARISVQEVLTAVADALPLTPRHIQG